MQRPIRLVTLAPGHFHAALVQKEMIAGVHPRVYVYAPLDYDLLAHLSRVQGFNSRFSQPTAWELDVRAGGNYLERFAREPVGNTAVIAGRNRPKVDRILTAVSAGLHVLADKPWIVDWAHFPKLEQLLHEAELQDLIVWDMMTERFEITNLIQRELIRDPEILGEIIPGSPERPGLVLESVHYLKKLVAGRPLIRPAWWFDSREAGEGLADVGTHLADLAMWLLFPDQPIDYRRDIQLLAATRSALYLTREQFSVLSGLPDFPPMLREHVQQAGLQYDGNGEVSYTLKGIHVRLRVQWGFEALPGNGDRHGTIVNGTRSRVLVYQAPAVSGVCNLPEIMVMATQAKDHTALLAAVQHRCQLLQPRFPGIEVFQRGQQIQIVIPDRLRTGHESHFAEVFHTFQHYFHNPRQVPMWERANQLAKYYLTTRAVELAKQSTGTPV
ncbi:MAG: hypothetical protein LC104_02970 [Bacteroidales bacterium]|nr:hypothetical protein [Bacteroidales bacterium]